MGGAVATDPATARRGAPSATRMAVGAESSVCTCPTPVATVAPHESLSVDARYGPASRLAAPAGTEARQMPSVRAAVRFAGAVEAMVRPGQSDTSMLAPSLPRRKVVRIALWPSAVRLRVKTPAA